MYSELGINEVGSMFSERLRLLCFFVSLLLNFLLQIIVDNFSYTGAAPDAFFYVGTSGWNFLPKKSRIPCKNEFIQVSQWEGNPDPIPGWRRGPTTRSQTQHIFTISPKPFSQFHQNLFCNFHQNIFSQFAPKHCFTVFTKTSSHNFRQQLKWNRMELRAKMWFYLINNSFPSQTGKM